MIPIDLKPDEKKLREFGWISLGGFALIGLLIALKTNAFETPGKWTIPGIFFGLALLCPLLGTIAPKLLRPIYVSLTLLAFPIGFVVSNLILFLIYFCIFTPFAIWFRIIGRDGLHRKRSSPVSTYWIQCDPSRSVKSYFRQF